VIPLRPGGEQVADLGRDGPVLDQIEGFAWSTEESVAYEAAIDAINGAVGAFTALIAAAPDPAVIAEARFGRAECARWRERLDPTDHEAVAATQRRFTQLTRDLRQNADE
jgi:hypothetical protein